jgi:hypothetical protein
LILPLSSQARGYTYPNGVSRSTKGSFVFSFRKICLLCCLTLIASLQLAMAQKSPRLRKGEVILEDPIFGLSHDPTVARYEEVPAWLDKKCTLGDHSWIYAHVSNKDSELFIVMSYSSDQDGDSFGNSFWVKGRDAREIRRTGRSPESCRNEVTACREAGRGCRVMARLNCAMRDAAMATTIGYCGRPPKKRCCGALFKMGYREL